MITKHKQIFEEELPLLLQDYFKNFNINSLTDQSYIYSRYMTLVQEKSLWSVKIGIGADTIGSGVICTRHMKWSNYQIKVNFYSQIHIEPRYRNQGYLKTLMTELDYRDHSLSSSATIVIARRAVGDLYYKFGFKGFSRYPIISLPRNKVVEYKPSNVPTDFDKLRDAHTSTYYTINGYFLRSADFWKATILNLPENRLNLDTFVINNSFCYVISDGYKVVEIATNNQNAWPRIIDFLCSIGVSEYAISTNHPAFPFLSLMGGKLTVRPEPKEGHMMRLNYSNNMFSNYLELESAIKNMDIEISVLDQW